MQKSILFILLVLAVSDMVGQEEKEVKQLDSIQINLARSLDSLFEGVPNTLTTLVLQKFLDKTSPKPQKKSQEGWKKAGKYSLFFNQAAFNFNWQGGGTSNIAGNTAVNYEFNYKRRSLTWDNKIIAEYGLTFLKGEDFARKTNDNIEYNSRLGEQIGSSFWNYSLFINFKSQFAKGYRFTKNVDSDQIIRTEETHFFSPAVIQIGPGLLWKKSDQMHINIAPLTSRLIFVDDQFTTAIDYEDGDYFGVDAGKTSRFEFGGSLAVYAKFEIVKRVTMENSLALYSNYIEDASNVDVDYTLNLNLVVNKYISGVFSFQTIYDDNATGNFQIRESIGLGLNIGF